MGDDAREPTDDAGRERRRLLQYGGLAALLGLVGVGAGVRVLGDGPDDRPPGTEPPPTTTDPDRTTPGQEAAADWLPLVERFAPDLHFGRRERWFPTDPRPDPPCDGDEGHVVGGAEALRRYTEEFQSPTEPPRPTVFYNPVPVDDSIVALQYWTYSVFDQFAVNFHWHDWELLQVFVDVDAEEVVLLSASAHARNCPNNEYLRPEIAPGERPVVLSEVGSHSSATDVNGNRPSFERFGSSALDPDVSNDFVRPLGGLLEQPFAYGLPRDEGVPVPYSLPELDDTPLHEHLDLPLDAFVDQDVTVRSWRDLARPPTDLPRRESGLVLTHPESRADGDATYELVPLADAASCIDGFAGPQLSFEFAIPGFVEDQFAHHLTTAGVPWEDPRSTDPVGDVTDPDHRRAVADEVPPGLTSRVVGAVSMLVGRSDGELPAVDGEDRDAVEPFVPVSSVPLPLEVACLLRSDPVATVTSGGVFRFLHVEPGTHELVVNGPGIAPYAERFDHQGDTTRPGVGGRVTLVATEDAAVLRGDRRDSTGLRRVRVVESFVGPVFDARPVEDGRFAVPVHRDGDYTVEVVDDDGVRGAVRVDPGALDGEPIPPVETGKAALAETLAEFLAETAAVARELGDGQDGDAERTIPSAFEAASGDALAVSGAAAEGDWALANQLLVDVVDGLDRIRERLSGGERAGYADAAASLLRHRAGEGRDMARTAYGTPVVE